jgi:hypothetical protein
MSPPADSRATLAAALREAAALLRSYAVELWPERLEGHAESIRARLPVTSC